MLPSLLRLCLTIFVPFVTAQQTVVNKSFRNEKLFHVSGDLNETQMFKLVGMTNLAHMNEVLDHICIPRVVGTPGHDKVKSYLKNSMKSLGWTVETDSFEEKTPNMGVLRFENIVAKLDPGARRYLVLACHYDSLNKKEFVGAIDSAVPCAQLLNLATVMREQLTTARRGNVSLMFIFFDGEEAFLKWSDTDSIYGARHLAGKWEKTLSSYGSDMNISELDKMDMLVLLDLLGAPNPRFSDYFTNTSRWFSTLAKIERALAVNGLFEGYSYKNGRLQYFERDTNYYSYGIIQDDHIPFLKKRVPILHLIPYQFPDVWHEIEDDREHIDMETTENLNKILRIFVASYLHLKI